MSLHGVYGTGSKRLFTIEIPPGDTTAYLFRVLYMESSEGRSEDRVTWEAYV